ncbi:glycosyltransferase family 4 protein [Vreelandella aquamarina]
MHIIHVNLAKGFRGGERQTVLLIQALENLVTSQTLVCRHDSPLRDALKDVSGLRFVEANHQLTGHIRAGRGAVVHAHEAKAVHWAWLHKRLYRTPYIVTRRVDTPISNKWSNRHFYSTADCCVAISQAIRHQLDPWSDHAVPVIPSAMSGFTPDESVTQAYRKRYAGNVIVGHVGALVDRHKGQRIILEAAKALQASHPDLLFVFFGRGDDEVALQQESATLDNVVWEGFRDDIGNYLPAFDLFVFPSRNEGLGSVLLDVMHARVPIIASDVGGIPDLINPQETGILIPPQDADALAAAIADLVEHPDKRAQLAQNAYADLERYTPQAMAQAYLAIYQRLDT